MSHLVSSAQDVDAVISALWSNNAGKQIGAHVDLHLRAFPSFESCTIVNRTNNGRAHELASSLRQSQPCVVSNTLALDDECLKDGIQNADAICTATLSEKPLFPSEWVSPGTHLNLPVVESSTLHAHEIDSELIYRTWKVMIDSRNACVIESGELIAVGKTTEPNKSLIGLGEDGEFVPRVRLQYVITTRPVLPREECMGYGTRVEDYHV